jgi:hypothetical protein
MASTRLTSVSGNGIQVWDLAQDETLRLPRRRKGVLARVEHGTVVVTQAGDPGDHVLQAGDEVVLPPGGLAVAWALAPAVLSVCDAAKRVVVPQACRTAA